LRRAFTRRSPSSKASGPRCLRVQHPCVWAAQQEGEVLPRCRAGVMCLDWSPGQPTLLAIGLYCGGVAVLDVRGAPGAPPLYEATAAGGKHSDPVWAVRWAPAAGGAPAFHRWPARALQRACFGSR